MIRQALRIGLIEHEASDTGGVPRWKSSCPDRLAEATVRSSKLKGKTLEIQEPIIIVTTDISGYVLLTLACIC